MSRECTPRMSCHLAGRSEMARSHSTAGWSVQALGQGTFLRRVLLIGVAKHSNCQLTKPMRSTCQALRGLTPSHSYWSFQTSGQSETIQMGVNVVSGTRIATSE